MGRTCRFRLARATFNKIGQRVLDAFSALRAGVAEDLALHRPGSAERLFESGEYLRKHRAAVAKAHFNLGRMNRKRNGSNTEL